MAAAWRGGRCISRGELTRPGAREHALGAASLRSALLAAECGGEGGTKLVSIVAPIVSTAPIAQACAKLGHRALTLPRAAVHQGMRAAEGGGAAADEQDLHERSLVTRTAHGAPTSRLFHHRRLSSRQGPIRGNFSGA